MSQFNVALNLWYLVKFFTFLDRCAKAKGSEETAYVPRLISHSRFIKNSKLALTQSDAENSRASRKATICSLQLFRRIP